jgi:hypothetical protein
VRRVSMVVCLCLCSGFIWACGDDKKSPNAPTPPATPAKLTAPVADSPADGDQLDTLRPTLVVRNGSTDQAAGGARTYEFQVSDSKDFTTSGGAARTFRVVVTKPGVAEDPSGRTSFAVADDLQPTTRLYWRARLVQGSATSEWSQTVSFKTRLMGFSRPGELYDPLIHGVTVGEVVGSGAAFIPGRGIQFNNGQTFVRYALPQTITNGEFSMDVEGLRPNNVGDKAKVFGMQEGTSDFITNRYRVDIQYRGATGVPPNAITFRVLYGSGDDLSLRYEPDTAKRFASVFLLNPSQTYHWKATWGSSFQLTVLDGGLGGVPLYDYGMPTPRGVYAPNPHYAYLGAPVGRSGAEAATIPGTIYRNVWLGSSPRPASLGSALQQ